LLEAFAVNGDGADENELDDDDDVVEDTESTVILSDDVIDDDDDGDGDDDDDSSEINVDKLVADIDRLKADEVMRKRLEARKRIDAMKDELLDDDEFGSTYNFNIDEDL
jgi:hypothetical protein